MKTYYSKIIKITVLNLCIALLLAMSFFTFAPSTFLGLGNRIHSGFLAAMLLLALFPGKIVRKYQELSMEHMYPQYTSLIILLAISVPLLLLAGMGFLLYQDITLIEVYRISRPATAAPTTIYLHALIILQQLVTLGVIIHTALTQTDSAHS